MRLPFYLGLCLFLLMGSLRAQFTTEYFWTGGAGNAWNDAANWTKSGFDPSGYPAGPSTTMFGAGTAAVIVDLGTGATTQSISFLNSVTGYTIGAGGVGAQTLTFTGTMTAPTYGQIIITSGSPVVQTINANMVIQRLISFTLGSLADDSLLRVAGNISGVGTGSLYLAGTSGKTARYEISGAISGPMNLSVQLNAKALLSGANSYTGYTLVSSGSTLTLGRSDVIPDSSNLKLSSYPTPANTTFATGGFSETLGSLELSDGAVIDFGEGSSHLTFANSNAASWTGSLSLANFDIGLDTLRFGTDANGLTAAQLGQISLPGYQASLDDDGFVSFAAVPEPSIVGLGAAGAFFLMSLRAMARRRQREMAG
jgi:fibronectin-binding autotransporter adhesin